jgi:hypothetical protein
MTTYPVLQVDLLIPSAFHSYFDPIWSLTDYFIFRFIVHIFSIQIIYYTLLLFNISDLLKGHIIEFDCIEFKEGWNPDAIYRSVCAFASDIENIGGGNIIIGSEEENGMAKRPVKGLLLKQFDAI